MDGNKLTYTTVTGLVIEYDPVSPYELELMELSVRKSYVDRGEQIDVPTYDVTVAGGPAGKPIIQKFPHDETTTKDEEEQRLWDAYKDATRRMNLEMSDNRVEMVLECIHVSLPLDDSWEERQRRHGIQIPEDPYKKLMHYIKTVVLRSSADFAACVDRIMSYGYIGTVSEEAQKAASSEFQNPMETKTRRENETAGGFTEGEPVIE